MYQNRSKKKKKNRANCDSAAEETACSKNKPGIVSKGKTSGNPAADKKLGTE